MARDGGGHVPDEHGALSDDAHCARVEPRPEQHAVLADVVRDEAGAVLPSDVCAGGMEWCNKCKCK